MDCPAMFTRSKRGTQTQDCYSFAFGSDENTIIQPPSALETLASVAVAEAEAEAEDAEDDMYSDMPALITVEQCHALDAQSPEPSPIVPDALRQIEMSHLKSIIIGKIRVHAIMDDIGSIEGMLEPDGTFSYDDGEVGHMGLNSFEFLWFLKRQQTTGAPLQSRIGLDPEYALRFIFFHYNPRKSVRKYISEMREEATVPPSYAAVLERLEAKEKALLSEIKTLEEIEARKARIRNLTSRRDELKAHLD